VLVDDELGKQRLNHMKAQHHTGCYKFRDSHALAN
jgi:hypothetical protein